jgi:transposase
MYGVAAWAARYSPELFDLFHDDIPRLHDDRLGACLARLYSATSPALILAVVRSAIREFGVSLDELHNDSTTVSFHGEYRGAERPRTIDGRAQPAITWGHSKDHRPDLKQLLFTLTVAQDGGVPVYFDVDNGNTTDDTTHCQTWDLLRQLVGRPDFLYVADCKLASRENLRHIAAPGGRFITVLPASRQEDGEFRGRLRATPSTIVWTPCWVRPADPDAAPRRDHAPEPPPDDVIQVSTQEATSSDGFRLLWFHSQRKAQLDAEIRAQRTQRAIQDLQELQRRLALPRTRFRDHAAVQQAVTECLSRREVAAWLRVEITPREQASFRQAGPGRPSQRTAYRRRVIQRFELSWHVDDQGSRDAELDDGIFPLLTNDRALTPREVLEAYKRQPTIEKRFAQLKSDFDVAPVFLKTPARVLGLFTVYFLALLVQSLLERELRRALERAAAEAAPKQRRAEGSIDLYPEGRRTTRPTARRALDALENLRRYELARADAPEDEEPVTLFDDLTPTQARLLHLFGLNPATYGR